MVDRENSSGQTFLQIKTERWALEHGIIQCVVLIQYYC